MAGTTLAGISWASRLVRTTVYMLAQIEPPTDLRAPITPVAMPMSPWSGMSMVVTAIATPSTQPMKKVPRKRSAMARDLVFSSHVAIPSRTKP